MSLDLLVARLAAVASVGAHDSAPPGGRPAVVLGLLSGAQDPEVLFTERAASLRSQPGQVSFPGGAVDDSDPDVVAAALRETREEIGLSPDQVRILGALPGIRPTVTNHQVTALVGQWDGHQALRLAPEEVAAVHRFRVSELADPDHRVTARHPRGGSGPAFRIGEVMVWGFTAWLTNDLLTLGGWQRPWDHNRVVSVPQRFRQPGSNRPGSNRPGSNRPGSNQPGVSQR